MIYRSVASLYSWRSFFFFFFTLFIQCEQQSPAAYLTLQHELCAFVATHARSVCSVRELLDIAVRKVWCGKVWLGGGGGGGGVIVSLG